MNNSIFSQVEIHSCPELMEFIQQVGFLPLLDSGIPGFSAEDVVDEDCRYVVFDDGWDWPLWKWKALLCRRATASMASSSQARPASSVASGGQTSATTVAVRRKGWKQVPSKTRSC